MTPRIPQTYVYHQILEASKTIAKSQGKNMYMYLECLRNLVRIGLLVHKCKYFGIGTFHDDTIVLMNKLYVKHIQKHLHGNQKWWVSKWWFI